MKFWPLWIIPLKNATVMTNNTHKNRDNYHTFTYILLCQQLKIWINLTLFDWPTKPSTARPKNQTEQDNMQNDFNSLVLKRVRWMHALIIQNKCRHILEFLRKAAAQSCMLCTHFIYSKFGRLNESNVSKRTVLFLYIVFLDNTVSGFMFFNLDRQLAVQFSNRYVNRSQKQMCDESLGRTIILGIH